MRLGEKYSVVFKDGGYTSVNLLSIFQSASEFSTVVWSGRIGTGLLGKPDCKSGRHGPGGRGEVLFGVGDNGLLAIAALGFIPCPVCQPEKIPGFAEVISPLVQKRYNLTAEEFADKNKLAYDTRRVDWEKIIRMNDKAPSRIYAPANLTETEQKDFGDRLKLLAALFGTPVGFYDHSKPGHFTQYFKI